MSLHFPIQTGRGLYSDESIAESRRCGAPSQTVAPEEAGYYTLTRSAVKNFLRPQTKEEDLVFSTVVQSSSRGVLEQLGLAASQPSQTASQSPATPPSLPICDRCHNLVHHHTGVSIYHPSIQSIEDIIAESPYKHNHVYHILDAADFPLSLIPSLEHSLHLPRMRSQNRRSKTRTYTHNRVAEISFIITRSDLLAPKKEQVDRLVPYLREVLREALGRGGRKVRLGNVRCVSAKRGWWTREVKEEIWKRGGAGWMVGKVNVGKSGLFEVVFPKGRGLDNTPVGGSDGVLGTRQESGKEMAAEKEGEEDAGDAEVVDEETGHDGKEEGSTAMLSDLPGDVDVEEQRNPDLTTSPSDTQATPATNPALTENEQAEEVQMQAPEVENANKQEETDQLLETEPFDSSSTASLLPPPQPETAYPTMPTISSLPGTTASPIRVPFGSGKGELIDLPGIARSNLETFTKPENTQDLVMKSRITPEQYTIKPGQSLLLGGLIRITPTTPDLVFLAYPFVPLHAHVTSTEKAVAIQAGERSLDSSRPELSIANSNACSRMQSAGKYKLEWDVTKKRAGPLTSPVAAKLKADRLPFVVYSADVLVEGVGWVEIVAQTRRHAAGRDADEVVVPEFEIFSPEGKFVGIRPPMNAWLLGGKKAVPKHKQKARPRRSMSSVRRSQEGRAKAAAAT